MKFINNDTEYLDQWKADCPLQTELISSRIRPEVVTVPSSLSSWYAELAVCRLKNYDAAFFLQR